MSPSENFCSISSAMLFAVCSQNSPTKTKRKPGVHQRTGFSLAQNSRARRMQKRGEESYARDGTWARYGSRAESALVKYQGRAKISATLLDVYKRSSIFRVLSHGSAAVDKAHRGFLCEYYARNGSEETSKPAKNLFSSKARVDLRFYVGHSLTLCYRQTDLLSTIHRR